MDKQAILNFLQTFQFKDKPTQYSKFYTTHTQEIPSLIPSEHTNEINFYITDEMIHDNIVNEQFLLNQLRAANEQHIAVDEKLAIEKIINPNSNFYSKKNVSLLNTSFTRTSLLDALASCNICLSQRKGKYLLVSPALMVLAKEMVTSDLIVNNYPIELIVNPYIRSNTFAAIITDAPNSFRHFLKKSRELSFGVKHLTREIEVKLSSERFFEVGNPMGIYTISF